MWVKQEWAEQEMSREQENSHLEWPDHAFHPYIPLLSWSVPFPCHPWDQVCRGALQPRHHKCNRDRQLESKKNGQTLEPGAYWINFFHESPEEDNKGALLTTQTHFTVMPLLSLYPQILVIPLIRLGMKWRHLTGTVQGRSWPLGRLQAVTAF